MKNKMFTPRTHPNWEQRSQSPQGGPTSRIHGHPIVNHFPEDIGMANQPIPINIAPDYVPQASVEQASVEQASVEQASVE